MKNILGVLLLTTLFIACSPQKDLVEIINILEEDENVDTQSDSKSELGGPPTLEQLIGTWKMVEWPYSDMNKVNPWPLPFQWFYFDEKGKIYSMMNSNDDELTSKELIETFEILSSEQTPNYTLSGQFVTIDNPKNKDYQELWGVNLFVKDFGLFVKKGDIVMTLDDGSRNGIVVYYRLLRKLK